MEVDLFESDQPKAHQALMLAKRRNADKTIPVRVNRHTVVFVREKQLANKKLMNRIIEEVNSSGL